ncbi:MAG: D-alanyl-D-alanine carboxypeptidase [Anaerolineae bacterium]|nr:D-alanyl-D-alanine carboxypeptidase [Anaerolineae bacterium]
MLSRRALFIVLATLSLCCLGFGPPRLGDSDMPRYPLTLHQIRAMRPHPLPEINAASALLVNLGTGRILYALNEHERLAPASLTKIVTALVALERGRQDQEMRVAREDLRAYSVIRLQSGEELNLRQLLFAMLIPSDNAAAMTIARSLGGNVAAFVQWMNALMVEWNLQDTHFANPSGLDQAGQYASAFDMAIVARQAMENPVFAEIVRKHEWIVAGRIIKSTNELLNTYPGTIGVKTGTTDLAKECLITVVDRPAGRALCVVMGSEERFQDTRRLMDYYFANYSELRVHIEETPQSRYLDEEGNIHTFVTRQPAVFLISPWQMGAVSFYRRIDDLSVTPPADQPIGALEIRVGWRLFGEVSLYAE